MLETDTDPKSSGILFSKLQEKFQHNPITESNIDDALFELAYDGKIYQPRPNYYKLLE